mgnify:CR=1 FL=1
MIITATREEYPDPHMPHLTNTKMVCSKEEAKKLHLHQEKALQYIVQYWTDHWQYSKYSNRNDLLNSNLHFSPIKKKIKNKGPKVKVQSKEIRRLTHHKEDVPYVGKFYTHIQIIEMMNNKILLPMKHDRRILQDFTEPMYRRFNAYISWVLEWDEKYNSSQCQDRLNVLKLTVKWI